MTNTARRQKLRDALWRASDGQCWYCGRETPAEKRTVDHLIPLSQNGHPYRRDNGIACCTNCNKNKASLTLEEFRARQARGRRYLPRDHPNRTGPYLFAFEREGWAPVLLVCACCGQGLDDPVTTEVWNADLHAWEAVRVCQGCADPADLLLDRLIREDAAK